MKIKHFIENGTQVFKLSALELLILGISSQDCLDYLNDIKRNTPEYHRNLQKLKQEQKLLSLTDADFESFKLDQLKWLNDFNNAKKLCSVMFNFLNQEAMNLLDGSSQKYYKKTRFNISSYPAVDVTLDDLKKAKQNLLVQKSQGKEEAIAKGELITPEMIDAMDFLKDLGFYPNKDYQVKEAIAKAFEVKLEQLIKAEEGQEQEIKFCDCETWIAGDKRCSCGNVRVYWEYYPSKDNFKELMIFPAKD